jgi:hypothetical protein
MRVSNKSKKTGKKSLLARAIPYCLTAAGILGGVFGLIQYGQMLGNSNKTIYEQLLSQLRQQIEFLSERHQVEIQKLQAMLESQRDEDARLRSDLARLQKELETTQSQLDKERD